MRNPIILVLTIFLFLFIACSEKEKKEIGATEKKKEIVSYLPFSNIELNDMSGFKEVSENWKLAGGAYLDRSKDQALETQDGTGVLINIPDAKHKGNLFTTFEHGDMELEVDVIMPKNSNSGLYFQGRYEVQLFDSWGKDSVGQGDMGGIYQRWDDSRGEGKEGFDGYSPKINAAKAPGLWQQFKIIFHAPKFDSSGNKTKNASFEEVWLNGVLIHENVELTGPTRAATFEDEKPKGPLMIQGDHGPVALKNLKYKLYADKRVSFANTKMKEFENAEVLLPNMDSLTAIREIDTDSISAAMATGERPQKILSYTGLLKIPESGDYLFDYKVNEAGGLFIIDNDTVVNLNGDYNLDSLGFGKKTLKAGDVPFQLIYNKHRPWRQGFMLSVEGPGIQKHALHAPSSIDLSVGKPVEDMMVEVSDEVVLHRSFLMHDGVKRTHCISVGTPEDIHYAYDLATGALLQAWNGDFIDATKMWLSRGEKQLGEPAGFTVSFHGSPEFASLPKDNAAWPNTIMALEDFTPMGYEIDSDGLPVFSFQQENVSITNKMVPSKDQRSLKRVFESEGSTSIWHKVAEGESIEKLSDGGYIINEESFFVEFDANSALKPSIRTTNGKDELLVEIPSGAQKLEYTITW